MLLVTDDNKTVSNNAAGSTPADSSTAGGTSTTPQSTTQQTQSIKTAASTSGGTPKSSAYNNAMQVLTAAQKATPSFTSSYDSEIAGLYDKIINRDKFAYDYSSDPLYGQYKENYVQQGRQAMRDTMGQAAALTGGYGSSYSQAVGQQQYDAYLQRLNDVLPELYANAYSYYKGEGDRLSQEYALASDMRNQEYSQFRDAVSDQRYADALAKDEALQRGQLGDWSAYGDLYGQEAAKVAAILSNPQAAYASGLASGEDVYKYTGAYPVGYNAGGEGGGGDGGGWAAAAPNNNIGNIKTAQRIPDEIADQLPRYTGFY